MVLLVCSVWRSGDRPTLSLWMTVPAMSLLPALKIGPLVIDHPALMAPMSGVTDRPFRRLARRFGAGLVYSEMIASSQMIRAHADTLRMSTPCDDEFARAVQLEGRDPEVIAESE